MVISAVLDACVLYPVGVRDTLLNVAEAGLFRVRWTEEILDETSRNIVADVPGLTADHLAKTFDAMRRAFPEAMVSGYAHLVDDMTNHPKDRHVLAAAIAAGADVIVTSDRRHFPARACGPKGVRVRSPDDFLCEMFERDPETVAGILRTQAARKRRPAMSTDEMLSRLEDQLPRFVKLVRRLVTRR